MKRLYALLMTGLLVVPLHALDTQPIKTEQLSFEIAKIDESVVKDHQKSIARTFMLKRYARYGAKGAGFLSAAYILYTWQFGGSGETSINTQELQKQVKDLSMSVAAMLHVLAEQHPTAHKEVQKTLADNVKPGRSWFGLGKTILEWTFIPVGVSALNSVMDKIFHEDTVEWFVTSQTKLQRRFEELSEYADGFDKAFSFETEKKQAYARALVRTLNTVVRSSEKLLGYMQYQMTTFNEQSTLDATLDIRCLHKSLNDTAQKVQETIINHFEQPMQKTNIKDTIEALKTDYERIIAHFSLLECEIE